MGIERKQNDAQQEPCDKKHQHRSVAPQGCDASYGAGDVLLHMVTGRGHLGPGDYQTTELMSADIIDELAGFDELIGEAENRGSFRRHSRGGGKRRGDRQSFDGFDFGFQGSVSDEFVEFGSNRRERGFVEEAQIGARLLVEEFARGLEGMGNIVVGYGVDSLTDERFGGGVVLGQMQSGVNVRPRELE